MKKNKSITIIILLSMLLPLTFLIISIYVYEDETPWEGFLVNQDGNITLVDDYYSKEVCIEKMLIALETNHNSTYFCGKSCEYSNNTSMIEDFKCTEQTMGPKSDSL